MMELSSQITTQPPFRTPSNIFLLRLQWDFCEQRDNTLLLITHFLSYHNFPAFVINPNDLINMVDSKPSIIVFDFEGTFEEFRLPKWFSQVKIEIDVSNKWDRTASLLFSKAMTLLYYYKYQKLATVDYFTSFLLLNSDPVRNSKSCFIYFQSIIDKQNKITVSPVINNCNEIVYCKGCLPEKDTLILIPPNEHPYYISNVDTSNDMLVVFQLDHKSKVLKISDLMKNQYYKFSNPPRNLLRLLKYKRTVIDFQFTDIKTDFPNIDCIVQKSILGDFHSREQYEFAFDNVSIDKLIHEIIEDPDDRRALSNSIGKCFLFPSDTIHFKFCVPPFPSLFKFEIGMPHCRTPKISKRFLESRQVKLFQIDIPHVIVNFNGSEKQVPANAVIDEWLLNNYMPVSGAKNAVILVFCVDYDESQLWKINLYFDTLRHQYSAHHFGKLDHFHDRKYIITCDQSTFKAVTHATFEKIGNAEFMQMNILSFVVHPLYFDETLDEKTITTYLSFEDIYQCSLPQITLLAFDIYSRMRSLTAQPFGQLFNSPPPELASLFFGFRFMPPYRLAKIATPNSMIIHIIYDPKTKISVWVDDCMSMLHTFQPMELHELCQHAILLTQRIPSILINFTFSFFCECVSQQMVGVVESIFQTKAVILSVALSQSTQLEFPKQSASDFYFFGEPLHTEVFISNAIDPKISCFVVSPEQPAYSISLYTESEDPAKTISTVAKQFSDLSWISVKPEKGERVISFPPHLATLLKKIEIPTSKLCQLEFLPQ